MERSQTLDEKNRMHRLASIRRAVCGLALCALLISPAFSRPTSGQAEGAWWPTPGAVILGGGKLSPATFDSFAKQLIALAGGPESQIVIIPSATANLPDEMPASGSLPRFEGLRKVLESKGALHVSILHTRVRETANSEDFVKALRSANGVWIPGGQSMLLQETYRGTLVQRELQALLARGGVVAGDSAGAIAIGCFWLTWLPDPYGKRSDELCVLPHVTVSPHASAAQGFVVDEEVVKYLEEHPHAIGIDIDEDTALVLKGNLGEVIGKGYAAFIDTSKDKTKPYLKLSAGVQHDFTK